ncbi:MAG: hypothetical protein H7839_08105 [Magnetococcus sp. YQC-5]
MKVTLAIALRGIRGGRRDFFFFSWAVFLVVVAVTGMAAIAERLHALVDHEARRMLAADLRLEAAFPFHDVIDTHLRQPGWVVAENLEFSAMVRLPGSSQSVLAEVLAAAPEYPLQGSVQLLSGRPLHVALAGEGVVVESALQTRLALPMGATLCLGEACFQLADLLQQEPDRVMRFFRWGPRLIIPKSRIAETGLVGHGSRVQYVALVRLPPGTDPVQVARKLNDTLASKGIRVMTPSDSQPSAKRFMERFTTFLGLMALFTLLTTGYAMAGAMAAHIREHRVQIAIFKSLGASHAEVMGIFFWRVLLISSPGSLAGAAVGMVCPMLLIDGTALSSLLPPFYIPLLGAAGGVVSGLLFSFGPLWGTRTIEPGTLFRAVDWEGGMGFLHWKWRWGLPLVATICCAVLFGQKNGWRTGGLFAGEVLATLAVLWLTAKVGLALLRRCDTGRHLTWRLAVRGLTDSKTGSIGAIVSVGLGLGVMCSILFLEQNLDWQMVSRLPQLAPSFFLIDVQADQATPLRELASGFIHDPNDLRTTPVVRGRIKAIKGVGLTQEWMAGHPQSWRFNRDYVLTWSQDLPPGNRLTAGRWWLDSSGHEASVEQEMARALGLQINDTITFDILGVEVSARITNLREVHWSDFGLNFFVVFSPSVLQGAPFSYLGSVVVEPKQEEAFRSAVVQKFHNVSAIASREVMERARGMLERLIGSVRLAGAMAVAAGVTALSVTVTLTRRRRIREVAIRRLLGTTQQELISSAVLEYALLGLIAAVAGSVVGHLVTAGVMVVLFNDVWEWFPVVTVSAWIAGVGVVTMTGFAVVRQDLQRPVMDALRGHD